MSLLDALLLEPPKFEVWIALRTDGALGSGTQADPYDGSTIKTAPLGITLSNPGPNKFTAHAVTATPHGFTNGDIIVVSRATNPADGDWWDGTFEVINVDPNFPNAFEYVMQREPLSSSPTDRTVQKYVAWRFDEVMKDVNKVPPKTTVHVGPGIFETRGRGESLPGTNPGWQPQNGQRILGAGMGLTTLKLVAAYTPLGNRKAAVIWSAEPLPDGLEVADMTIDCNADDQPSHISLLDGGASQITVAPINVMGGGRHIYIHRVRAINFGSRVREFYSENMVFYISSGTGIDSVDAVIEDCVAEFPSPNNRANSFLIQVATGVEADFRNPVRVGGFALVMRNCYADGRNSYGPVVPVDRVEYDDKTSTATVVTRIPHRHKKPGNLIVANTSAGGGLDGIFNGLFPIESVIDDTTLTCKPPVDDLFLDEMVDLFGGFGQLEISTAVGGTIGGAVPSGRVAIDKIEAGSDPANPRQLRLVTKEPHFRTTNNTIMIHNIHTLSGGTSATLESRSLPIVRYDPAYPNVLEFATYEDLDVPLDQLNLTIAFAKGGHTGSGADDGISENNYISHVDIGGPYQDTFKRRTTVARNNYYHNVSIGPYQQLLGVSFWSGQIVLESLDYDDTELVCPTLALHSFAEFENSIAIAKLYQAEPVPPPLHPWVPRHGFIKKPTDPTALPDLVTIIIDPPPGQPTTDKTIYQGTFTVLDTPDSRTFTYEANGTATVRANGPFYREGRQSLRPLASMTIEQQGPSKWIITATVKHLYPSIGYTIDHGLAPQEVVRLSHAGPFPNRATALNGYFKITEVGPTSDPDPKNNNSWFKFEVTEDPGSVTGDFSPGYWARMWGLDWMLAEGNIIELAIPVTGPSGYNASIGLFLYGGGALPQYRMRQVLFRDNLIRNIDNRSDPNKDTYLYAGLAEAIRMEYPLIAENALWQNNIVRLDRDEIGGNSMTWRGAPLRTFDNNAADGNLILARDREPPNLLTAPELVTAIQASTEDALIASFLL